MMVRCNAEQYVLLGENCVQKRSFKTYVFVNFIAPALIYDAVNVEQHVKNIFECVCQELM
jgi:transcription antitermination factor NusG